MPDYPKTIRFLLSLNKRECLKFRDYIESPYFNKVATVPILFKHIIHQYKEKEKIYNEAELTKITYGNFNVRKYQFDLQKLKEHFENFASTQILENNVLKNAIATLEDYLYRNNGDFFELKYKQTKRLLESNKKEVNYFQFLYEIENLKDTYISLYKDKRTGDTNLQLVSDAIDKDFLVKKLCYVVLMLNRQSITQIKYDFGFRDYVLNYLSDKKNENEPIINLFYWAYQILTKTNEKEAFELLYQQLLKNDHHISTDIISALFLVAHNNIKFIFDDRIEQNNQYFRLYGILLKQHYIQIKGEIHIQFFKCVFTVCLELGKYDYLEEFLKQYEHKLYPEEFAHEVVVFSKAKLLLYKGELTKLMNVDFNMNLKDSRFKFEIKCVEIMLNYELQEFIVLKSLIGSFKVALSPERIKHLSESKVQENRNFINCFNKLYRLSTSPNITITDVNQLIKDIETAHQIADQKWLLIKARDLL